MSTSFDGSQLEKMGKQQRTNLINSLSGYKSANLLGSINSQKKTNLALMSSIFHVGANPPLMGCLLRPHTVPRHSLENILEMGCFTLNAVTKSFYKQAHQTSARYPREQSEFDAVGLTAEFSDVINAPYVSQSPIKIGLSLVETQQLTTNNSVLVIGEIKEIIVATDMISDDDHLQLSKMDIIALSGLDEYHLPQSLGRLPYPKP